MRIINRWRISSIQQPEKKKRFKIFIWIPPPQVFIDSTFLRWLSCAGLTTRIIKTVSDVRSEKKDNPLGVVHRPYNRNIWLQRRHFLDYLAIIFSFSFPITVFVLGIAHFIIGFLKIDGERGCGRSSDFHRIIQFDNIPCAYCDAALRVRYMTWWGFIFP